MDKPHLSPSALGMIARCPEQFRRRYIEGEIIPPGVAMLKGTGVHAGAAANFRQKIISHEDVPASEIVESAVASFEAESQRAGVWLSREERSRGEGIVMAEAKDATARLAAAHACFVAPEYQPVVVEERFRIEAPGAQRDLVGVVDLIDDKGRVVDHKTTRKSKSQDEADNSIQLTAYAVGARQLIGKDPESLRLDVLVELKKETKRQVLETRRGPEDFGILAKRMNAAMALIEAGVFHPAPQDAWWCHPDFCGYHDTCPYVKAVRPTIVDLKVPVEEKKDG